MGGNDFTFDFEVLERGVISIDVRFTIELVTPTLTKSFHWLNLTKS